MPQSVLDRQHAKPRGLGVLPDDMLQPLVGEPQVLAPVVANETHHGASNTGNAND
jgi:hypothetical protein